MTYNSSHGRKEMRYSSHGSGKHHTQTQVGQGPPSTMGPELGHGPRKGESTGTDFSAKRAKDMTTSPKAGNRALSGKMNYAAESRRAMKNAK